MKINLPEPKMVKKIFFPVLILLVLLFLTPKMKEPFWGHHEFNGVFYAQIVKNYLRYGLVDTRGAQITSVGVTDSSEWSKHTHHPSTFPLILAGWSKIWGLNEFNLRALSLIATIVGVILLTKLSKNKLVVIPLVFTPLLRYYGTMPVFEPLLLPLIVGILIAYKQKKYSWLFWCSLGAILLDWPGYWPVGWIIVLELLNKNRSRKMLLSGLGAMILGTGIILGHQWLTTGHAWEAFLKVGGFRAGMSQQPFTMAIWIKTMLLRARAFYGLPLIITTGLGTVLGWRDKNKRKMIILAILIAISHSLVFRNIAWYHDYMLYHAIPLVVIATAIVFNKLPKNRQWLAAIGLALLTGIATQPFFKALSEMEPYRDCIEQKKVLRPECGQFVKFYIDEL
jgi:hypothetical protein